MLLYLTIVAVFGVMGDILMNQWAKTDMVRWWVLSIPVWIITATLFGILLRKGHYSFGATVIIILLLHSGIALAWDALIERAILTPMQWIGVGAAIVAITLMEIGRQ
jgi:drug/metabolite transporter superfamily protein YnfA